MLDERTWLLIGRKKANEASPQELKELEEILRTNPELHFSLQTLSDLWQQSPSQDNEELDIAYSNLLQSIRARGTAMPGSHITEHQFSDHELTDTSVVIHRSRKPLLRRTGLWASMVAVAAAAWIWAANPFAPMPPIQHNITPAASEISTRYGSKTNIVLPDGSKVWLNAGSKITYDENFGKTIRKVILTGEAYFDVTHNAEKPFIIHTKAMDIKVLGTEFNVKSYPDETTTETSLIRGSIEVTLNDRKADRIILKPNEKLVVSNQQETDSASAPKKPKDLAHRPLISLSTLNYFSRDSTVVETSWVDNRLLFEDESFEEIAQKMTRWYGVEFNFSDKEIKQLRFTGNFKEESLNDALKAMQITADFGYRITDKYVTITKR